MITDSKQKEENPIPHYYGDKVRQLLLAAGFLILLAVIFDRELQNFYIVLGVVGVLIFTILAGLTSPQNRKVLVNTAALSAAMFLLFEYFAISNFLSTQVVTSPAFLLREALAVIFLTILYFSTKTLRGTSSLN
jgi:hypothetical protein